MKMHRRIIAALFVLALCMSLSLSVYAAEPQANSYGIVQIVTGGTDGQNYLAVCVEEDGEYYVYSGIRPIQDQIAGYTSLTSDYDINSIYLVEEDTSYKGEQGIYRFELDECLKEGTSPDIFPKIARVSKKDTVYFVYMDRNYVFETERTTVSSVRNGVIKTTDGLEQELGSGDFTVIFNSSGDVVGFCKNGKAYAVDSRSDSGIPAIYSDIAIGILIGAAVGLVVLRMKKKKAAPVPGSDSVVHGPNNKDDSTILEPVDDIPGNDMPAPAMQLVLKCHGGYLNGRIYPIPREGLSIGREADNHIRYPVKTPGVSRHHVKLFWQDGQLMLLDLDSSNGTYLNRNGRMPGMRPVVLNPGDCFYLGENKNGFEIACK